MAAKKRLRKVLRDYEHEFTSVHGRWGVQYSRCTSLYIVTSVFDACRLRLSFKLRGRGLASFQDPSHFFILQVTKWWVGVARMGWCIPCLPSLFYYDYFISLLAIYIHDGCMIMHAWHCWSHRAVTREDRKPMQKEYGEYRVSVSALFTSVIHFHVFLE